MRYTVAHSWEDARFVADLPSRESRRHSKAPQAEMVSLRSKGSPTNKGLPASPAKNAKAKPKPNVSKKAAPRQCAPKDHQVWNCTRLLCPLFVIVCCLLFCCFAQLPEWCIVEKKGATDANENGEIVPILQASWARRKPLDSNNYLETAFYRREQVSEAFPRGRWLTLSMREEKSEPETLKINDLEERKLTDDARAKALYRRVPQDEEGVMARTLPKPWEPNPVPWIAASRAMARDE